MKICLIGSTGHWAFALNAVSPGGPDRIVGLAPGSREENMEKVAKRCAEDGHAPRRFSNHRRMLDALKPDVVSVACRFRDHAKIARHALERKCHLFIEKPPALTIRELARLREAHSRAGTLMAAMLSLRYNPAFIAARQAVRSGAIGDVRLITAQKSYKLGTRPDYYKSRRTYGGTIPWVGSHAIDLLAWFAGAPFRTVFATHSTRGNGDHGELEATALCLFTFEDGIAGSANIDYLRPSTAPSHGDDRIRVAGTEGVVEVRDNRAFLINQAAEGVRELEQGEKRHIFSDFLKETRGEGQCLVTAEDSFRMNEACLLARRSADECKLIKFPGNIHVTGSARLSTAVRVESGARRDRAPIRTAIIGVSGYGNTHYRDLLREVESGRMKAVAAAVRRPESAPEKCEQLRSLGCRLFRDYREMLKETEGMLDLCMIPTGIHLHAPMSIDAMRSGANVFVEKPAAALYDDVLKMQAVEHETGKFVAVGYQAMYGDEVHAAKKAIIGGRIGRVHSIHGIGLWPRLDSYYARNPWAGKIKAGEDVVLDSPFNNALAHYLNIMLFCAGAHERCSALPVKVFAELFRAHEIESCDTAALKIETDTGTRLHFLVTHCSETVFGPLILIKGEKGTIELKRGEPSCIRSGDGRIEALPRNQGDELRIKIMDQVTARIGDPTAFICGLDIAGMHTLSVNAAHRSCDIMTVPADHVRRTPEKDSIKTVIIGIDELFHRLFGREMMIGESDAEWAAGMTARPVETEPWLKT